MAQPLPPRGRVTPSGLGGAVGPTKGVIAHHEPDWRDARACTRRGLPADLMFNPVHVTRAKALCSVCPVWERCLDHGLDEPEGIWGGLDRAGRGRLRRLRLRLRTSSADTADNLNDIRRLLKAGMSPERLSVAIGLEAGTITTLAAIPTHRRRRAARPAADAAPPQGVLP